MKKKTVAMLLCALSISCLAACGQASNTTFEEVEETAAEDLQEKEETDSEEGINEDAEIEEASEEEELSETEAEDKADMQAPSGDGLVSEEELQKGYVWMDKINKDIFNATYEDMAEYFGVDGKFEKEEWDDHMEQSRRYYFWTSSEDENHFIYVNFGEKDPEGDPGVYKVTGFNCSGFSAEDAANAYLQELTAKAQEEDKEAAANAQTSDLEMSLYPFADEDNAILVTVSLPQGWSVDDRGGKYKLVDNEDSQAFGAGFIQIELKESAEKLDTYKDSFEDLTDVDTRTIAGIEMAGRSYKYIGYDWIEYTATLSDGKAISIGIVDVDIADGTMGAKVLDSIAFK